MPSHLKNNLVYKVYKVYKVTNCKRAEYVYHHRFSHRFSIFSIFSSYSSFNCFLTVLLIFYSFLSFFVLFQFNNFLRRSCVSTPRLVSDHSSKFFMCTFAATQDKDNFIFPESRASPSNIRSYARRICADINFQLEVQVSVS